MKLSVPSPTPRTVPLNVSRAGAATTLPLGWMRNVAVATVVPNRSPDQVESTTPGNLIFTPACLKPVGISGLVDHSPETFLGGVAIAVGMTTTTAARAAPNARTSLHR